MIFNYLHFILWCYVGKFLHWMHIFVCIMCTKLKRVSKLVFEPKLLFFACSKYSRRIMWVEIISLLTDNAFHFVDLLNDFWPTEWKINVANERGVINADNEMKWLKTRKFWAGQEPKDFNQSLCSSSAIRCTQISNNQKSKLVLLELKTQFWRRTTIQTTLMKWTIITFVYHYISGQSTGAKHC